MKNYYDLIREYQKYIDHMYENDASYIFTFEEYINHLFSTGKINEKEKLTCYDYQGYFKDLKINVDHD